MKLSNYPLIVVESTIDIYINWFTSEDSWRRQWQPTPVFLPGESQGWGSLVGCRLWGCTESDMTEAILGSSACPEAWHKNLLAQFSWMACNWGACLAGLRSRGFLQLLPFIGSEDSCCHYKNSLKENRRLIWGCYCDRRWGQGRWFLPQDRKSVV